MRHRRALPLRLEDVAAVVEDLARRPELAERGVGGQVLLRAHLAEEDEQRAVLLALAHEMQEGRAAEARRVRRVRAAALRRNAVPRRLRRLDLLRGVRARHRHVANQFPLERIRQPRQQSHPRHSQRRHDSLRLLLTVARPLHRKRTDRLGRRAQHPLGTAGAVLIARRAHRIEPRRLRCVRDERSDVCVQHTQRRAAASGGRSGERSDGASDEWGSLPTARRPSRVAGEG